MGTKKGNIIGIDLGTTNTVVAKGNKSIIGFNATTIEIPQYDETGNNVVFDKGLASVLYKRAGEDILHVGRFAKAQKKNQPTRTLFNTKRYMGLTKDWVIDEIHFSAKSVASEILRVCKLNAERQFVSKHIDGLTISVPASFTNDQIRDTKLAAVDCGFPEDSINIITEPTAALVSYINDLSQMDESDREIDFSKSKRILVFDIGGGTCDVCVIDVSQNGTKISLKEKAVGRYEELGGIDFDQRAAENLLNEFLNDKKINFSDVGEEEKLIIKNKLVAFCEQAKEKFSREVEMFGDMMTDEQIKYEYTFEKFFNGEDCKFKLNKKEFDRYTRELYYKAKRVSKDSTESHRYKNIESPIVDTLKEYDVDLESVDFVFLTGGMSQYKNIRERVKEVMKIDMNQIILASNPMDACAVGAAIYHYFSVDTTKIDVSKRKVIDEDDDILDKNGLEMEDETITSEAFLIDVVKGLPNVIIPKGTQLPCYGTIKNKFKTSSPSGIKVNIYAGEDEYDSRMRIQRTWRGYFEPPIAIGTPLDIEYRIDKYKDLTLKIIIKDDFEQEFELTTEIVR